MILIVDYEMVKSILPQLAPGKRNFKAVEFEFSNVADQFPDLSNLLVVCHVDCILGFSITILADWLELSPKGEIVNLFCGIYCYEPLELQYFNRV